MHCRFNRWLGAVTSRFGSFKALLTLLAFVFYERLTYRVPVCALQFTLFFKSGDILRVSLDSPASVAEAVELIREFSASECFSFLDERLTEARQGPILQKHILPSLTFK